MENQEETTKSENFLLYASITILAMGVVILATMLGTGPDQNIFSNVKTKWRTWKGTEDEPENVNNTSDGKESPGT